MSQVNYITYQVQAWQLGKGAIIMAKYYIIITTFDPFVGQRTRIEYASSALDAFITYHWFAQFEYDYGDSYYKVSKPYPDPDKYVVRIEPHVYHKNKDFGLYDELPW
jgi:hypothetical protein